ncbi:MAG: YebC/PmpR family DNA-binding transcriptional regulator [Bacillota bacterium]|jgi:YebC/PmpR family DNA-binding regulatory protein|nr:YebC/PmpR family DNA-binding transcriptional regulator [Bacillota bacterium]
MSGHSKWANIRHRKAKGDAAKGNVYSKMAKEIMVAARHGGGNPDGNFRLKIAIQKARDFNVPWDNIQRAIKRGTGELEGITLEELTYEGYGPGGVAVVVEVLTDNRNRTASDLRYIFSKSGGNLAESGATSWLFKPKGSIMIEKEGISEDDLMVAALDAGADDLLPGDDESFEVTTAVESFGDVEHYLRSHGVKVASSELIRIPQTTVQVTGREAEQTLRLMESLEEHDDVQKVFSNFDISDEELDKHA